MSTQPDMMNITNQPAKEVLKLTPQEGRNIVYGDTTEFKVKHEQITQQSRWTIHYEIVVERLSDGKFFKSNYRVGATEMQDEEPYQYTEHAVFVEVKPTRKTVIVFE